jgi:tetratricopeptide (TPR) repeat protein
VQPSTQIGLVGPDGRYDIPAWAVVLGAASLLGLAFLALAACRARAARRPGPARAALADLAWFLVPLLPVLQIVPLGYTTLVAERFLYVPLLGVASLVTRGLRSLRTPARAVALAAAVGCAVIVVAYLPSFRSNETLWAHELGLRPRNPLLHLYAARAAWQAARLDAALGAARTAYEHAEHPEVQTQAAILWAEVRLQKAQGRDQALMEELRSFFDAIASGGRAVLVTDEARFEVELTPTEGFDPRTARSFRSARAIAHARTGSYDTGETLLRALLPEDPSPVTAMGLARVLACQERWNDALAVLAAAAPFHPRDAGLGTLAFTIRRLRDLAASSPADALDRAIARAELWVQLGVPALARRDLAPHVSGHADDPRVLIPLAFADAADGDVDSARRVLATARDCTSDPGTRAVWDAALVELLQWGATASEAGATRPDAAALFR